jgi:CO/xanthine dehydrogenase FAD-binding subunit
VTVHAPDRLPDALAALAGAVAPTVLAGGTDLMVDVNYGRRRPGDVLSLRRLAELRGWRTGPSTADASNTDTANAEAADEVVLGAAVTYTALLGPELAAALPALAQAARTVGSPQIRNTGTIGGNLGTASPAGDTLPVLVAHGATVELASAAAGRRTLPVADFLVGPKQSARRPDELITAVRVPVLAGPAEFLKIGVRNAMVIAVANCALVIDWPSRTVRCVLGSVGPVPIRDPGAEAWLADRLDWAGTATGATGDAAVVSATSAATLAAEFGARMAAASRPIDDHRATAEYRRHAVGVLARRALERALGAAVAPGTAVA